MPIVLFTSNIAHIDMERTYPVDRSAMASNANYTHGI